MIMSAPWKINVDEALERAKPWATMCGSCDLGLPMKCTCAQGDPRPIVAELINVVTQLQAETKTAEKVAADDRDDFINKIMSGMPDSWDDDAAAEHIVIEYVRALEKRVVDAGGTLERWTGGDA